MGVFFLCGVVDCVIVAYSYGVSGKLPKKKGKGGHCHTFSKVYWQRHDPNTCP